ncbi:GtrA family protein [Massilia sp. W12]|uniref:GtrA family protein n=1 Tax=Massilia sp. W12 TaxID=3126507 RepID=UPI0030CBEBF3
MMSEFTSRARRLLQQQHWRFAAAGVVGLLVDMALLGLLLQLACNPYLARLAAFLGAVCATWLLNRHFTFAAVPHGKPLWLEWLQYLLAMSGGGLLNLAASGAVLYFCRPAWWLAPAAVVAGSLAGMLFNFCAAKWWVFRA